MKTSSKFISLMAFAGTAVLTGCASPVSTNAQNTATAMGMNTTNAMTGAVVGVIQSTDTTTAGIAKAAAIGAINGGFGTQPSTNTTQPSSTTTPTDTSSTTVR